MNVKEDLKFCENAKKVQGVGFGSGGGGSGFGGPNYSFIFQTKGGKSD